MNAPDDASALRDGAPRDAGPDWGANRSDAFADRSFEDAPSGTRRDASDADAPRGSDSADEPRPVSDGALDGSRSDGARDDAPGAVVDGAGASDTGDATIRDASAGDVNNPIDPKDSANADRNIDARNTEDANGTIDVSFDVRAIDVGVDTVEADAVEADAIDDAPPDVGFVCGFAPPAPGGICPEVCNEGCVGGICRIGCREEKQCKDATLECPPGFTCQVNCVGKHACEAALVNCPDAFACNLLCSDDQSCKGLTFNCRSGTCNVDCLGNNACEAVVNCGPQTCTAVCQGSAPMGRPKLNCGESCDCRSCAP